MRTPSPQEEQIPSFVSIEKKIKTYLRRGFKIVQWIFAGIVGLIILAVIALQFPGVQRWLSQKALASISERTHTLLQVGSVNIVLPNSIVLHRVFIEGRQRDTLLFIQTLSADVNLFRLFSHDILLKGVRVDSLTAHITRTLPDSSFNFDFILNALSPDSVANPDSPTNINPNASASPGWKIRFGAVRLNGFRGTYDDSVSGLKLRIQLGTLKASLDNFDIEKELFHIDELSLVNARASVLQTKESASADSSPPGTDFAIGTLSLATIHVTYENTVSGERYGVDLGTSTLTTNKIDLPAHHIDLKTFLLENTNVIVAESQGTKIEAKKTRSAAVPWTISLDQLILSGNSARYDVEGTPRSNGIDWNHLSIDGLAMRAKNVYYSQKRFTADVVHTSFREHSGLELHEMSGGFMLDSLHAQLRDFIVETSGSHIRQNVLLGYDSIDSLTSLSGEVDVKATIDDSRIAIADLLLFLPTLPVKNFPDAPIRFSSRLSGLLQDLQVEDLHIATGDSTTVDLAGSIFGLPEPETARYNMELRHLTTTRNDIRVLGVDTLLPKNIVLPGSISIRGSFNGTPQDFSAAAIVETNIGTIKGNVTLNSDQESDSATSRWKGTFVVEGFDVGSLLNDRETFGQVSLTASFAGTGRSKDDIMAQLNVRVDEAVVNGYLYRGLSIRGTASPTMFDGTAEIQDSSVAFTFEGILNTSEDDPTYKFTLDLKGADLHRLNLTPDDIRVAGFVTSDLSGNDFNDINGSIDVRNLVVIKNNKRFAIDSLVCRSVSNKGKAHISIESAILAGELEGTIVPGELADALTKQFASYGSIPGKQSGKNLKAQDFTFHFTLKDPATLTDVFVPELRRLSAATILGVYESDKKKLNVSVDVPRIEYSDFIIDSLAVRVTSDADLLQVTTRLASIADSSFRVTNLQFAGKAGHDSIDVVLQTVGRDGMTKLLLAGVFSSVSGGYKFRFNKDGVVFQNLSWSVAPDNYILFGKNDFVVHDVNLRGAGQSLSLQSADDQTRRPPLTIAFSNFDLATLSRVVERDTGLIGGTLNGNVKVENLEKRIAFTSDLIIKDFSFGKRHVGDITLKANNQTEDIYAVTMGIAGNGNQIALRGQYRSRAGGSELDLTWDFTKVNLASIEPFIFGNVRRLSGTMTGGLHVTGTITQPSISGELSFVSTAFVPTFLDTYLHLANGTLVFDGSGVDLRSFDLVDTLGNIASVSGHLSTDDFRSYSFDLRAHTDNFLLLNKPASRDALYSGTVILNSDISVKGNLDRPVITVQAELAKGTNLALTLPESELAVEERRGIVRFVAVRNPPNAIMARRNLGIVRDTTTSKFSSMDLTSNITVNKDSRLRILIDPVAGDSLVIHGDATLSFSIDPSGKLTLTGRYEIVEGSYQLSFGDFIKREFDIEKGSSLTWFGSPYEATVDITAIYTVNASMMDLIQNQLAGASREELNKYKQEVPIQVYLIMKGKLLTPEIHFRLDMPPDQRGVLNGSVYAKVNELNGQESELNKQVFALLVLGRFISESTIASSTGNSALSDLARSSASQILSTQLNRLSEQYLAGVNLNVGVESYQDYSTGNAEGRTQLQLALSKKLFDERVNVQIGGSVDLEGRRSQQNSLNSFAGDLKVQYKLTDDGRWQLEVFRQHSYEGAIDGDITKTGVGVVFIIDFDKLFGLTLSPTPVQRKK